MIVTASDMLGVLNYVVQGSELWYSCKYCRYHEISIHVQVVSGEIVVCEAHCSLA